MASKAKQFRAEVCGANKRQVCDVCRAFDVPYNRRDPPCLALSFSHTALISVINVKWHKYITTVLIKVILIIMILNYLILKDHTININLLQSFNCSSKPALFGKQIKGTL